MIPQRIDFAANLGLVCELAAKWKISPQLSLALHAMALLASNLGLQQLLIVSGHRTAREQKYLDQEGRPTAPDLLSTHRTCPATGADLRMGVAATNFTKAQFGQAAVLAGLRWGGGSRIDPHTGLPFDWNHVDLGPREEGSPSA